jgi:hypothetical protein
VDEVPDQCEFVVKNTATLALQLVKRFRNIRYATYKGRTPPSVMLSYYAGTAAKPDSTLSEMVMRIANWICPGLAPDSPNLEEVRNIQSPLMGRIAPPATVPRRKLSPRTRRSSVLTRTGYRTAVAGNNGFVCLVERGFSGAPDWPERWNPKIQAAGCLNPQAARSIAPIDKLRTKLTLAGRTDAEILNRIKLALRTQKVPPLEPGAMCYMMSKSAYLTANGAHVMAHVMFYLPFKDGADWGANAPGSPIMGGNYWFFLPNHKGDAAALPPVSVLRVGSATWSDGTPATMPRM